MSFTIQPDAVDITSTTNDVATPFVVSEATVATLATLATLQTFKPSNLNNQKQSQTTLTIRKRTIATDHPPTANLHTNRISSHHHIIELQS
jgi:hypothetical protein